MNAMHARTCSSATTSATRMTGRCKSLEAPFGLQRRQGRQRLTAVAASGAGACRQDPTTPGSAAQPCISASKRFAQTLLCGVSAAALSGLALLGGTAAHAAGLPGITSSTIVYDGGNLIAKEKEEQLAAQLADFERQTGWRIRVLTSYGPESRPGEAGLRAAWKLDKQSVVIEFDPTSPNILSYPYLGDNALVKLRRPWWLELQGRYGNLFYVREEGEQAAVLASTEAVMTCLGKPEGCAVVPGLPAEQYYFTLALAVVGGLIAGFVSKLEPQGFIQRRWIWLVIFSPLWGNLLVNFGIGPIVSRTDDKLPIAGNLLGFFAGAAAPYVVQVLRAPAPREE